MYHTVALLVLLLVRKSKAVLGLCRGKRTGAKPTFLSLFGVLSTTAQAVNAKPDAPAACTSTASNTTTSSASPNGQARLNC